METGNDKNTFQKRLKSMLGVDIRRMSTSPLVYLFFGIALIMPILILVMTKMNSGTAENATQGFNSVWQIISTKSESTGGMDILSMCNMNMMYFLIGVFCCIFISDDFRSGYCKNLFTIRSRKTDYVISKTITCFLAGMFMMIFFFVGSLLGGTFASLSFDLDGLTAGNIIMCLLSKISLVMLFVSIFVLASVLGKARLWLSIIVSLGCSMLLFMMLGMISPLDSTFLNFILCLVGSLIFACGLGAGSYFILSKISII